MQRKKRSRVACAFLAVCALRVGSMHAEEGAAKRQREQKSSCRPVSDASGLDLSIRRQAYFRGQKKSLNTRGVPRRRDGIVAVRCIVAPRLRLFLFSDTVANTSWPAVEYNGMPPVSLENPVARRQWPAAGASSSGNMSMLHLDLEGNKLKVDGPELLRDAAGQPYAVRYSAYETPNDASEPKIYFHVVIRVRPGPGGICLLRVDPVTSVDRANMAEEKGRQGGQENPERCEEEVP